VNWIGTLELAGLLIAAIGIVDLLKRIARERRARVGRLIATRVLRASIREVEDDWDFGSRWD
jgi:hypothetical protein